MLATAMLTYYYSEIDDGTSVIYVCAFLLYLLKAYTSDQTWKSAEDKLANANSCAFGCVCAS